MGVHTCDTSMEEEKAGGSEIPSHLATHHILGQLSLHEILSPKQTTKAGSQRHRGSGKDGGEIGTAIPQTTEGQAKGPSLCSLEGCGSDKSFLFLSLGLRTVCEEVSTA